MISSRKTKANRTNARVSTGPRTVTGKARAAQNSRRHGLCIPVTDEPELSLEIESLAREIFGEGASAEKKYLARRIAEAQIELVRVREARQYALTRELNVPNYRPTRNIMKRAADLMLVLDYLRKDQAVPSELMEVFHVPEGADKFANILLDLLRELEALDRYERRALSARKFAVRCFDAHLM